jgi:hypothetical protein
LYVVLCYGVTGIFIQFWVLSMWDIVIAF